MFWRLLAIWGWDQPTDQILYLYENTHGFDRVTIPPVSISPAPMTRLTSINQEHGSSGDLIAPGNLKSPQRILIGED